MYIHIYFLFILQVLTNSTCRRINTESYVVSTINWHPDFLTYQHLCLNVIVHFSVYIVLYVIYIYVTTPIDYKHLNMSYLGISLSAAYLYQYHIINNRV